LQVVGGVNVQSRLGVKRHADSQAKVSHELRTPLTPIHGALALIKSGKVARLPEKLDELGDMAARNCASLMLIVNDLLDFTRVSSGRFSLDSGMVELQPFLERVIQNKHFGPDPPNIRLKVSPQDCPHELRASRSPHQ